MKKVIYIFLILVFCRNISAQSLSLEERYIKAYTNISSILMDDKIDFRTAVFLTENTYYEGKLKKWWN